MNIGLARAIVKKKLLNAVTSPDFEADQIICGAIKGIGRAWLHSHPEAEVSPQSFAAIMGLAERRVSGEPLAYVLGNSLFCGRQFITARDALIPRPETEILTEIASSAMRRIAPEGGKRFADWCTGSGCIAITLVLENPGWSCWAVDSSEDALRIARENAALHGARDSVKFLISGSPSDAVPDIGPNSLDFVVSNPPYIPTNDISSLEAQVADYEPRIALDGGDDGLDAYRMLIHELPALMKPGAELLLETGGASQADEVLRLAGGSFELVKKYSDHREIGRFLLLKIQSIV
jgi:release factor glutamine methyltransferase